MEEEKFPETDQLPKLDNQFDYVFQVADENGSDDEYILNNNKAIKHKGNGVPDFDSEPLPFNTETLELYLR